jgi:hypothetical protein
VSKAELLTEARALGLRPPQAYVLGFDHANCGQLCLRGGQKILRERRAGRTIPLSLSELRRRYQADQAAIA